MNQDVTTVYGKVQCSIAVHERNWGMRQNSMKKYVSEISLTDVVSLRMRLIFFSIKCYNLLTITSWNHTVV